MRTCSGCSAQLVWCAMRNFEIARCLVMCVLGAECWCRDAVYAHIDTFACLAVNMHICILYELVYQHRAACAVRLPDANVARMRYEKRVCLAFMRRRIIIIKIRLASHWHARRGISHHRTPGRPCEMIRLPRSSDIISTATTSHKPPRQKRRFDISISTAR